jgi:hypothetical protein
MPVLVQGVWIPPCRGSYAAKYFVETAPTGTVIITDGFQLTEILATAPPSVHGIWIPPHYGSHVGRYFVQSSAGGSVIADIIIPLEQLASSPPPDTNLATALSSLVMEFGSTIVTDVLPPVEYQGTASDGEIANSIACFEWLRNQVGDATLTGEVLFRAMSDALTSAENLSMGAVAVDGGTATHLEVTAPVRTDAGSSREWVISVLLVLDTPLPAEVSGDRPAPIPAIPQVSSRRARLFRV